MGRVLVTMLDISGTPVSIEARQYNLVEASDPILHAQDVAPDPLSKSQKKRLKKKATAERKKQEAEDNGGEGTEHCVSLVVSDHWCLVFMQLVDHHRSTYSELTDRRLLRAGAFAREENGHAAEPPTQLQQPNGTAKKGKGR